MVHRSTLETAETLLDRFFREAEGRTNHQLDVGFILSDIGMSRATAEPGLDYLVSRGLLNTFGPDVAYLTDDGVRAAVDELDIGTISPVRSFVPAEPDTVETPPPPAAPHLVHVTLRGKTSQVPLGARCTIGRSAENDVTVDDPRASKRHAVVRYERGAYVLEDLESANGTLLNGHYCVEPTRLGHDDEIVIGGTMLVYQAPETFPPPPDVDELEPLPSFAPTGAPTARPASAPDLGDPAIRVIRGRPEEVEGARPSDLFDPGPEPGLEAEVFRETDGLASTEDPLDFSDALEATDRRDALEANPDLQPTLLGDELTPIGEGEPLELSDVVEPGPTDDPSLQRTADAEHDPDGELEPTPEPQLVDPDSTLELLMPPDLHPRDTEGTLPPFSSEDAVVPASDLERAGASALEDLPEVEAEPLLAPEATTDDAEIARAATDEAESLPVATPSLADFRLPDELGYTETPPRFIAALARLRSEVRSVAGAESTGLLDAIDTLIEHPLVRAFAENEDPES